MIKFEFINHGTFEEYVPQVNAIPNVLYCRSTNSCECWYSYVKKLETDRTLKLLVDPSGRVRSSSRDATLLFPVNFRVIEIIDENLQIDLSVSRYFDTNTGVFSFDLIL